MTDPDAIRVGTPERDDAIAALGHHHAAQRLPADEYEQRVALVHDAQTRGDLRRLFADLPEPYPRFMMPEPFPVFPVVPYESPFVSDKSRIVAGLLQLLLPVGAGRFYTRNTGMAVAQLITAFFGVGVVWCFVDGIILLLGGGRDGDGLPLKRT
jgi:TM2 domain-containing membrane protein YozV